MSAALTEQLLEIARAAEAAGHGARTRVYVDGAKRLGISVPTLLKRLADVAPRKPRKRRADAGKHALSRAEAMLIAATIEHTRRETSTGEIRLEDCLATLRSEGKIAAGQIDEGTGEFTPLSLSAIRRALTHYGCHPEQLAQPTAATRLSSPHPNYCWQIDASVSRQFYLADDGTRVMDKRTYYRGKPQNFVAINDRRLWRYVVTDHCSGYIEVFYVQGAESAINVVSTLIYVMTQRADGVMHGVPKYVMADPGSAMKAATVANFLDALGVEMIINKVGNARAKGQVESAQYTVETTFEAPLKLRAPVTSLEEINTLAALWSRSHNATRLHTRTGMTRRDGWLHITPEQLVLAPPIDVLRSLSTSAPEECTVRDYAIKFQGQRWDLRGLAGVMNGARVRVVLNPFDAKGSVRVLTRGEDGRPAYFLAPVIGIGAWGFDVGAAQIGVDFAAMPDSPADAARKEIERIAMQVDTDAEAVVARKNKRLAFGGDVDPTKPWRDAVVPKHLPRAGTASMVVAPELLEAAPLPVIAPVYVPQRMTHVDMARALKPRIEARGATWDSVTYARMAAMWPDGEIEERLDECAIALLRGGLRAVGGAA